MFDCAAHNEWARGPWPSPVLLLVAVWANCCCLCVLRDCSLCSNIETANHCSAFLPELHLLIYYKLPVAPEAGRAHLWRGAKKRAGAAGKQQPAAEDSLGPQETQLYRVVHGAWYEIATARDLHI